MTQIKRGTTPTIRVRMETITVTTAFAEGEYGWWGGVLYKSKRNSNVYTPAQYADNWEAVTE